MQEVAVWLCGQASKGLVRKDEVETIYRMHRNNLAVASGRRVAASQSLRSKSSNVSKLVVFVKLEERNRFISQDPNDPHPIEDAIDFLGRVKSEHERLSSAMPKDRLKSKSTYNAMLICGRAQLRVGVGNPVGSSPNKSGVC
jgi:hypothetical protein